MQWWMALQFLKKLVRCPCIDGLLLSYSKQKEKGCKQVHFNFLLSKWNRLVFSTHSSGMRYYSWGKVTKTKIFLNIFQCPCYTVGVCYYWKGHSYSCCWIWLHNSWIKLVFTHTTRKWFNSYIHLVSNWLIT